MKDFLLLKKQKHNNDNSQRVRELIDKLAAENDGSELSDFVPIDRPNLNFPSEDIEKDLTTINLMRKNYYLKH